MPKGRASLACAGLVWVEGKEDKVNQLSKDTFHQLHDN